MKVHRKQLLIILLIMVMALGAFGIAQSRPRFDDAEPGLIKCANLIYGNNKSSVCFSDEFLAQAQKDTYIRTSRRFYSIKLGSPELFDYPFAIMTGEGSFVLSKTQRENLRNYLLNGGFLLASAGCSSEPWNKSFRREIAKIISDIKLTRLKADHPAFHTVYDITKSRYKSSKSQLPVLEGLTIDGRMVLVYTHPE